MARRFLVLVFVIPVPKAAPKSPPPLRPTIRVTDVEWNPDLERVEVIDPGTNWGRTYFRPKVTTKE